MKSQYSNLLEEQRIQEEAMSWVVENADSDFKGGQPAFQAWLNANPKHIVAYETSQRQWQAISELKHLQSMVSPHLLEPADDVQQSKTGYMNFSVFTRILLRHPLAVACTLFLAIIGYLFLSPADMNRSYETQVAEMRTVSLPDGTEVTLGAKSAIDVSYSDEMRHVTLVKGEAFFDVIRDSEKPFLVKAGYVQVSVLGTKFNVRRGVSEVDVSVSQGLVSVSSESSQDNTRTANVYREPLKLKAGEVAKTQSGKESIKIVTQPDMIASWKSGRLYYESVMLEEVIADANRYYDGSIIVSDGKIAKLKVTGSFEVNKIEEMLGALTLALSLKLDKNQHGHFVIKPFS